ncbi:MAG TPA: hypothetical protein VN108_07680, partial [Marmoricola sp.]|nr:hypothetical protein [Marmoricola sp.]
GARGWTCNLSRVSNERTPGGFRVWRYVDRAGHTCAFYDTSLASPASAVSPLAGPSLGTAVVDMSNPAKPRLTTMLTSLAMLSPHESLNLNAKRGLLAAEVGNALTLPGTLDVYSVAKDCRHPQMLGQAPIAMGHESGFSPDGRTFWVAGASGYIYAFDLTDPRHPRELWKGAYFSHGLSLSPDGRTLYQTDPINGNLGILDVSQIQRRSPHPVVREIRRFTWPTVSIPQNSQAFTSRGHKYLLEFDEFAFRFNPVTIRNLAGATRIVNIDNPKAPRVVSNLRLAVQMPANHAKASGDPNPLASNTIVGYGSHYCALQRTANPNLVACSELNSGLWVFNIANPAKPRVVAYFVSPPRNPATLPNLQGDLAFSQPAFDAGRHDIWYSDAVTGLYVLHLNAAAWK